MLIFHSLEKRENNFFFLDDDYNYKANLNFATTKNLKPLETLALKFSLI